MSIAVKTDPALWARVKQKWLRSDKGGAAGQWNARKAMLAVQEYKRLGGHYVGPRSQTNSLKKWEREDWATSTGTPRAGIFRRENALKRRRAGEWVPYSASVNAKMPRAGVYAKPRAAKPRAVKPRAARPRAAKPLAAKPRTAKPRAAKPLAAKPRTAKPRAAKPRAAKPRHKG